MYLNRQSLAASRTSYASANAQAAATAKLFEKKKEYDAVSALEKASSLYLQRIEGLAEDLDVMADAGQVQGQVLEQWPGMFQILSLFLGVRPTEDNAEGERLVRIPIEGLQETSSQT
ncbi:hypothetical protein AX15_007709 [Amanita polypyramis BW_CC]|nr:hypothetical protein AX15_007709 [Amanita polypyramis BW_CC]